MNHDPANVIAVGELLWDLFPDGPRFGGAPINFAHHAAALGGRTTVVTAIGDDELGEKAMQRLRASLLQTDHVQVRSDLPTGTVKVTLDEKGSASYRFNDCDAWDQLHWSDELQGVAAAADAICFGSLGQRTATSRSTIQRLVAATPETSLRVFDVNLRSPHFDAETVRQSLELANVLKLNEDELPRLVDWFRVAGADPVEQVAGLADQFGLRVVALTQGSRGSLLWSRDEVSHSEPVTTRVIDTVGAGDAFTAGLVTGLLEGADLGAINRTASKIAAFVCSHPGATPDLPEELKHFD